MNATQTPPHDRDDERALLGGVIRDPETLTDVLAVVNAESFYFDAHQRIFTAVCDLAGQGVPVDLVGLNAMLRQRKQLDDIGGVMYLTELWEAVPTGANAAYHATLVRDARADRPAHHQTLVCGRC